MTITRQHRSRLLLAAPVLALGVLALSPGISAAGGPPDAPGAPGAPGGTSGIAPQITDDANVLNIGTLQTDMAGLPIAFCVKTSNMDAQDPNAFDQAIHGMLGPNCPVAIGTNPQLKHTSIQLDESAMNAAGITKDQALTAARQATDTFNNNFKDHNDYTAATAAAVGSLKGGLWPNGIPGMNAPGMNMPSVGMPSANIPVPSANLPGVNPPSVAAPTVTNPTKHFNWSRFWEIVIPLALLFLLGLLLWRLLRRGARAASPVVERPVARHSATYTKDTGPTDTSARRVMDDTMTGGTGGGTTKIIDDVTHTRVVGEAGNPGSNKVIPGSDDNRRGGAR